MPNLAYLTIEFSVSWKPFHACRIDQQLAALTINLPSGSFLLSCRVLTMWGSPSVGARTW